MKSPDELYDYPGFQYQWTSEIDTVQRIRAASNPTRWRDFVRGVADYRAYCQEYNGWGETPYISVLMESYSRALNLEWARIHHYVLHDYDVLRQYPDFDWWMHFYNFRNYLDSGGRPYWPEEFDEFDKELRRLSL